MDIKVKLFCAAVIVIVLAGLYPYVFGNKQFFDTAQDYDYAIIQMPDGKTVEGNVKTWNDYEGEQIQVVFENGDTYLTSSYNCVLIDYQDK